MPTPSFSVLNGQIPTSLRVYDNWDEKYKYRAECAEVFAGCPFKLLTPQDRSLPFQFKRTSSVLPVVAWKLFDMDDQEVLSFGSDTLDLLTITPFEGMDYVTYNFDALGELLPEGFYYFGFQMSDRTHYSEDFYVACNSFGENMIGDFSDGLYSEANADAIWSLSNWARLLTAVKNTAGAPTNPEHEYEGSQVANTNENNLYTYTGGSWGSSTPSNSTGWYDQETGNWYRFQGGVWQGLVSDPVTVDEDGICYDGASFPFSAPSISINIGNHDCIEQVMRFEFTVEGMTQGQVMVSSDDYGGMIVEGDGSYSFTAYVANGYVLSFTPSLGFDGCITSARLLCPRGLDDCNMKLTWTNCGAVGNIYYPGLTQVYYLPLETMKPRAEVKLLIDSEEDEEGNKVEVGRRKETVWTVFVGIVPWFVVDALTSMCLHDEVRLHYPTGGSDLLVHPRIDADRNDALSKCYVPVTLTFELDSSSVACCDTFDPPCLTSCVEADGFDDDTLQEGGVYLFRNQPRYSTYVSGSFEPYTVCESGLADIVAEEDAYQYTVYWDVNTSQWEPVALQVLQSTQSTDPCVLLFRYVLKPGYRGRLQFQPTGELGYEDQELDLSAEEWATNTEEWTASVPSGDVRIEVYIGDCVIGYSEVSPFDCGV